MRKQGPISQKEMGLCFWGDIKLGCSERRGKDEFNHILPA